MKRKLHVRFWSRAFPAMGPRDRCDDWFR